MPKITAHGGPSYTDDVPAPTDPDIAAAAAPPVDETVDLGSPAVVVDEHGDDVAAVATPADVPKRKR